MKKTLVTLLKKIARSSAIQKKLNKMEDDYNNRGKNHRPNTFLANQRIALTVLALFALVSFFVYNIYVFSKWPPEQYSDPLVFNLTRSNVTWDVHYGTSPKCGEFDCHVTSEYPQTQFERQQILPVREFPLKDWQKGTNVYYRARITIPMESKADAKDSALILHIPIIWGDNYSLYINQELVDGGRGETIHLPIPKSVTQSESFMLAIRVTPGNSDYQGIANYGAILIGEKSRLKNLQNLAERLRVTYYVWLLLPRLAFAVFFAWVFLAFSKNKENFYFLVYCSILSVKILLISDLGLEFIPAWVPKARSALVMDIFASLMLITFFLTYYRRQTRALDLVAKFILPILCLALGATFFGSDSLVSLTFLRNLANLSRLGALSVGLLYSAETAIYLADRNIGKLRLQNSVALFIIISGVWGITVTSLLMDFLKIRSDIFYFSPGFLLTLADLLMFFFISTSVATELGQEAANQAKVRRSLQMYVGKEASQRILQSNRQELRDMESEITIMFTDIRSFTTLAETHPPKVIVETLNDYFGTMEPIINKYGGSIDKFIGDSIMAEWGGAGQNSDPLLAVQAAIDMRSALIELNTKRVDRGLFPIAVGIGIHFGRAISGSIGSSDRREFTVIGDTVNVGARIQDQTKVFGFDILVSESVLSQCQGKLLANKCDANVLRGRAKSMDLYRLLAVKSAAGGWYFGNPLMEEILQDYSQSFDNQTIELPSDVLQDLGEAANIELKPAKTTHSA